jgi:hypothetical protein
MRTNVKGIANKMSSRDFMVKRLPSKIAGRTLPCSPMKWRVYAEELFAVLSEAELAALLELTSQK